MRNGVEVGFQIYVNRVLETSFYEAVHSPQRVFAPAIGAKSLAVLSELSFQDWFQYVAKGVLRYSVTYGGNS